MGNTNWTELFKRPYLILVILGVIVLLIISINSIPIGHQDNVTISSNGRTVLTLLGSVLLMLGFYGIYREYKHEDVRATRFHSPSSSIKTKTKPYAPKNPISWGELPQFESVKLRAKPIALLHVISGPLSGTFILITPYSKKIMFGRGTKADVSFHNTQITDDEVSRKHFVIKVEVIKNNGGKRFRVIILDTGSANGTHINDVWLKPRRPKELSTGDEIWIGESIMKFYRIDNNL